MFKDNIDSIFAKKKVKNKDAEEDSKNVSAILDVFGNGQVGSPPDESVKCQCNVNFFELSKISLFLPQPGY